MENKDLYKVEYTMNYSERSKEKISDAEIKETPLTYENDEEYRMVICKLFAKNGDFSFYKKKLNVDESSLEEDELEFDEMLIMKNMEHIYILTKENYLFQNLYDLAAAKMLSTDRSMGQCILFSYDYLQYYYSCICIFINTPEEFTENCLVYKTLVETLGKK